MLNLCNSVFLKTLVAPNATANDQMQSVTACEHLPL